MAIYLETNALRKLTNYECNEPVYTSIFSIFELLSGINEKEFDIRKACLKRIAEQKLEIRGPMIDKLFNDLIGESDYNKFAEQMIKDIYRQTIKLENYFEFNDIELLITETNDKENTIHAREWLENWDNNIASITTNSYGLYKDENKDYIRALYKENGDRGLAEYFWDKFLNNKIDEKRLMHAEAFVGSNVIEKIRKEMDELFSKYNYKLFIVAQAVIFAKAYINGNTQNSNNASDLLHLLYLNENDKFVSNDKIYKTISDACPDFNLIFLKNQKTLSELI